jgi:hypothetical protein
MSKNLNISVLVAARDEYIEQLKSIMCPLIIQGVNSIYQDALKVSEGKRTIWQFQQFLKDVITWNQTILQEEAKRIKKKCPYIMDIVTAIFVSNVKILASIRLKGDSDNIKVKIPTCEIFVHSVYIESAQQIFYDPKLFYHKNGDFNEIQKNKKYVREIIFLAIEESIRKMMPFDHILQEYLKNALDDNAEYTDSDESEEETQETPGETLNNDKIIESESEEEEPEENTTKDLHINGLSEYQVPQPPPIPVEPPSYSQFQPTPPMQPPQNNEEYSDSGSDSGSDLSDYSDSDSGSDSGSDSDSSVSSEESKQQKGGHHESHERHEERGHEGHKHRHKHGEGHSKHRDGKHRYSFF